MIDLNSPRALEHLATIKAERDELRAALADVELRCTQARLASGIGKKKDRTQFLIGELDRIAARAEAELAKAGKL